MASLNVEVWMSGARAGANWIATSGVCGGRMARGECVDYAVPRMSAVVSREPGVDQGM